MRSRVPVLSTSLLLDYQELHALQPGCEPGVHVELLLRLRGEDGREVLPGAFLPAAERYGLMPLIDRWVVKTALAHVDRLAWELKQVPQVQATLGLADVVRQITAGSFEGNPKWLTISRNQDILNYGAQQASVNNPELFNTDCSVMPLIAFLEDVARGGTFTCMHPLRRLPRPTWTHANGTVMGGSQTGKSLIVDGRILKRGGRLLVCGATAGYDPKEDLRYIWSFELKVIGSNSFYDGDLQALMQLIAAGKMRPVIDKVLPLAEAREGLRLIQDREVIGKVVVAP